MQLLILKLTTAPILVALASLIGRRFGPKITGWVAGFPIVAGPVLLFLALEQGTVFAAAAAAKTLQGFVSLCLFLLVYNWTALKWPWPLSLLSGWAAFGMGTAVLKQFSFDLFPAWAAAVIAFGITYYLLPKMPEPDDTLAPPKWDLPLRMIATAGIVLALTTLADRLGPDLSGLLTPFPVASAVLSVFAHAQIGAGGVERVIKGLIPAMVSLACFCVLLSLTLVPWGIAAAFTSGLALTAGMQTVLLFYMNRTHRN